MREIGKFFRVIGLSGALVLGICLLLTSPSQAGTIYDDFNNTYINPNLWHVIIKGTGPTVIETGGRLEITFPANSTGDHLEGGVETNFELVGDFDVQADFDLLTWPTANGFNVSIETGGVDYFQISRYSYSFSDKEGYLLDDNGNLISVPTSDMSGKLRLKRTGDTMEAFYWQNNAWHSMGASTDSQFAANTRVHLYSDSGNPSRYIPGEVVKVAFDNFQVTNQYLGPRGSLNFLQLLLE